MDIPKIIKKLFKKKKIKNKKKEGDKRDTDEWTFKIFFKN